MEAELAEERLNQLAATQAILTQAAIIAVLSKEGGKEFTKLIEELTGG